MSEYFSSKIAPAVNQIEAHPYLQQRELLKWSKEKVSITGSCGYTHEACHFQELISCATGDRRSWLFATRE
jgi:hypothetical protein